MINISSTLYYFGFELMISVTRFDVENVPPQYAWPTLQSIFFITLYTVCPQSHCGRGDVKQTTRKALQVLFLLARLLWLPAAVNKMDVRRKGRCVSWPAKFESVTRVRREYRDAFNGDPPHENNTRRWDKQLKETGSQTALSDECVVTSLNYLELEYSNFTTAMLSLLLHICVPQFWNSQMGHFHRDGWEGVDGNHGPPRSPGLLWGHAKQRVYSVHQGHCSFQRAYQGCYRIHRSCCSWPCTGVRYFIR